MFGREGKKIPLSDQNIIENEGILFDGWPSDALKTVIKQGIMKQEDYPFKGKKLRSKRKQELAIRLV